VNMSERVGLVGVFMISNDFLNATARSVCKRTRNFVIDL
jgi:hypothetical protein